MHVIKASLAGTVAAIAVVDFLRAVNADAHHEVVFFEECAPLVSEQGAVGLQGIADRLFFLERPLQLDNSLEKIDS